MDQFKADAVRMNNNPTGETAVMDKAIESNVLSVDQYAEQLMDDLFQGIEQSLETGKVLEEEAVPAPATVQTFVETTAAPLSVVLPAESTLPETVVQPEEGAESAPETPEKNTKDWSLRILWAAALLSCAGALALCVSNWDSYKALVQQLIGQAPAAEVSATVPTATAEAPNQEFANYIQQSLDALASQPTVTSDFGFNGGFAAPAPALPPAAATVPGGVAPATTATLPSTMASVPPGTILERVYIPVYQTPQGLVPVVPGVPVPNLTPSNTILPSNTASAPMAPVAPTAAIAPATVVAPTAIAQPSAIAAAPQPPTERQSDNPPTGADSETAEVQPMAVSEHTLVGLLELGNSSAALFEVSGVTRRFSLGEKIGSSGWTLVEVQNSEAIVRRNGEIRSIFVGQTF